MLMTIAETSSSVSQQPTPVAPGLEVLATDPAPIEPLQNILEVDRKYMKVYHNYLKRESASDLFPELGLDVTREADDVDNAKYYSTMNTAIIMVKKKTGDKVPTGIIDAIDNCIDPIINDGNDLPIDPDRGSNRLANSSQEVTS
ncbi:hypothetical protein M422DRAFT_259554 [Sphaerobolus stellatus SS14]|uniref:Uncharacterized protein n=1 Tax=Sphaerobolus stellatus (strain SS14) TaxID=990650 RepID=A0A0C9V8U4_SPHS4|nr:hypothetical protein M422DRAFT_259554 [Sphaerobolus stellatus SS14]